MMDNILLTHFDEAPFSKIKISDYIPAFQSAIKSAEKEIENIAQNAESPTFENTIHSLAFSGMALDRISAIFFNLNAANTNDEMQKLAQEIAPLMANFSNNILLNYPLFLRIKSVYGDKEVWKNFSDEQQTLLEKTYKNFVRNGALLSEEEKEKLREIDQKLSVLSLQFSENVLAETQNYQLHITQENDVEGVPQHAIDAAKTKAQQLGKNGYVFTLDMPSYLPFITYANNRNLRKEIAIANGKKGFQQNDFNNEKIVLQLAQLRKQRANLLGYASHADFVLEERMAQTPQNVISFLDNLLEKAKPAAQSEYDELEKYAKKLDHIDQLEKWDGTYYAEKLKQEKFDIDDELLKPYFELNQVLHGAFEVASRLFQLNFTKVSDIDVYHDDVNVYRVSDDNNNLVALLYTDFFPRKGKKNGAWMTSFKHQWKKDNDHQRPHISIVCNFTPPIGDTPSLLTFQELTTLFHEFGHALHGMLANTVYPSLSGTSVYWDFVELPSQIFENWVYEPEVLSLFAKHYKTGEIIPTQYIEKIKKSATFLQGMATIRQLSFGYLDMGWHYEFTDDMSDVKAFENEKFAGTQLYPDVKDNVMTTSFSHIFSGGYSSGYYSYKWAEVLDADAFEYFKDKGIFNHEVAQSFKENILSKGGTQHPMTLYKKFRGKVPSVEPLLKRAGLIPS